MPHIFLIGCLSILAADVADADVAPVEVQTLSGDAFRGELRQLDAGNLTIAGSAAAEQTFPIVDLLSVNFTETAKVPQLKPHWWQIDLIDGSRLVVERFTVSSGTMLAQLPGGDNVDLSTHAVAAVLMQPVAAEPDLMTQWKEITDERRPGDTLVIRVRNALDHLSGAIGDVTDETVAFNFDGDVIDVKRERLAGWTYYHPIRRQLPERICRVFETGGSIWSAKSLSWHDGHLDLVTPAGVSRSLPVSSVVKLDFASGNVVYLSDLDFEFSQWRPFIGSSLPSERLAKLFEPRRDQNVDGGPLMLDGRSFRKGLAIRSRTEIWYRLTEPFRSFHAVAGIDDSLGNAGNVELVIHGDDRELFRQQIRGDDEPIVIDLDMTGVRRLRILVDFGAESDVADQLNLCEARLTK